VVASARRHWIGHRQAPRRCSLPGRGRATPLAAPLAAAVVLSACGGAAAPAVRHGGQLVVAVDSMPLSLNPLTAGDVSSVRAYAPLYPLLYDARPDLSLTPDLAAAMPQLSADGMAWTVRLRPGARWSDNAPMTAADVVYTVSTESDPTLAGDAQFDWSALASVEQVDPLTVRFTLRAPDASFATRLVTPIIPAHVLSRYKPAQMDTAFFDTTPSVSGGPFMYKGPNPLGAGLLYVPNPHWYGGAANVDRLVVTVVSDPRLVPSLLAEGQVLWAPELAGPAVADAEKQFGVHVAAYPELSLVALQCNERGTAPTADVRVRQALSAALDRGAVAQAAEGDGATVMWGDVPTQSWAYDPAATVRTAADPGHARALLDAAHLTLPLSLDLLYPRGDAARAAAASSIAAQAAPAGFHVTPHAVDPVALHSALAAGQFTLALTETGMSLDPDDSAALASDQAPPGNPGGRNWGGYASAAMDRLLAAERTAVAAPGAALQKARRPLLGAVEQQLGMDLPFIPLYAPLHHAAYNVTVNGLVPGAQLDQDRDASMYGRWYIAA
jgi:peptide/nickel transport system substrate-binding protein